MKKKISELSTDELNRVVAVMRGYSLSEGEWFTPFGHWYGTEGKYCPDFSASPELWWPIAEETDSIQLKGALGRLGQTLENVPTKVIPMSNPKQIALCRRRQGLTQR